MRRKQHKTYKGDIAGKQAPKVWLLLQLETPER